MSESTQRYIEKEGLKYSVLSDGSLGVGDILNLAQVRNGIYDASLIKPKLVIPPFIESRKVTKLLDYSLSGSCLFYDIKLPYTLIEIGDHAMNDNYALRSLFIPASVEKIKFCGISGMKKCKSLIFEAGSKLSYVGTDAWDFFQAEELTLPSSITSFGDSSFAMWSKLKRLYICFDALLNNATNIFSGCRDDLKIFVKQTYEGEYFGGRKVTKIDSCGIIQQYHPSYRCTNKFTLQRIDYIALALMTLSLS